MNFGNYTLSFGADDIRSLGSGVPEKHLSKIYPVSSWNGQIEELCLPYPDFEVCENSLDKIIINLIQIFEKADITLLSPFLLEKSYPDNQAFEILKQIIKEYSNEKRSINTIYVPNTKLWLRDNLFVFKSLFGHKSYLLEPDVLQKPKFGLANYFNYSRPNVFEKLNSKKEIEGGNFLFGDEFFLTTSMEWMDVFTSTKQAHEDNHLVGQKGYETNDFCIPDTYEHIQILPDRGSEYERSMKYSKENFNVSFQDPLYHLDLFANLLGYGEDQNEFRILIGELENVSGIKKLTNVEKNWFEGNNLALSLISNKLDGFQLKSGKNLKVIRTPIPVVCEVKNGERKWIPLPFNNGLVENFNNDTLLYIPTFSPIPEASCSSVIFCEDLRKAEEKFAAILKTHKISLRKLTNYWKMIQKGGALHCLSLEIGRTKK